MAIISLKQHRGQGLVLLTCHPVLKRRESLVLPESTGWPIITNSMWGTKASTGPLSIFAHKRILERLSLSDRTTLSYFGHRFTSRVLGDGVMQDVGVMRTTANNFVPKYSLPSDIGGRSSNSMPVAELLYGDKQSLNCTCFKGHLIPSYLLILSPPSTRLSLWLFAFTGSAPTSLCPFAASKMFMERSTMVLLYSKVSHDRRTADSVVAALARAEDYTSDKSRLKRRFGEPELLPQYQNEHQHLLKVTGVSGEDRHIETARLGAFCSISLHWIKRYTNMCSLANTLNTHCERARLRRQADSGH
ncbi:hypothetical protein GOBAR_AA27981 [Gossypium barbadense]|uniref:Uncharacterized protein n=1 Tax=Gossypium barbadense TaxID=3634 RepID=A0A2P5WNT7_GOSBA|nr:hypothetical protein GOBAR_AA27981 [Gossypium barbadense]